MDLLDTIETKVASGLQVLFSTHSPFMVKTNILGRTRITEEDQGPERGSVVISVSTFAAAADGARATTLRSPNAALQT